jgi:hypothetical protein
MIPIVEYRDYLAVSEGVRRSYKVILCTLIAVV